MKKLIKMEFKRVFHSKMFYLNNLELVTYYDTAMDRSGASNAVNIVDGYIPSEVSTPV